MTSNAQILVPRGGSWGRAVAGDIRARGGDPLIAPLIDFAPPEDPSQLQAAFEQLRRGTFDWLTVTSASTVRVMTRWNAHVPRTTSVAAVGRATATALASAGYRVALVPDRDHSARGMLDAWPADARDARVLALGSAAAHPTLAEGLREIGCDVTIVPAYRTVGITAAPAVVDAVRSGRVGAILLTSGSVAREVVAQFGTLPDATVAVAIGEQTAADARDAGIRVDAVTADHSATALAARAVALLNGDKTTSASTTPVTGRTTLRPSSTRAAVGSTTVTRATDTLAAVPLASVPLPGAAAGHDAPGRPAAERPAADTVTASATVPAVRSGAERRLDPPPTSTHDRLRRDGATARHPQETMSAHPASLSTPPVPTVRPRRLRTSPAMRRLVAETRIHPAQLILPMFVREGAAEPTPIDAMPGVVQHSVDSLRRAAVDAAAAGVGGVMLFGVPARRDAIGSAASDPDGILNVATRVVADEVGDALVVQTDLCLDEFTDHGHCGVLDAAGRVDNDATLVRYAEMAVAQAHAGSALLGLSGMMDGQVAAVRAALDATGHADTAILGYAAKYASAFYGPFREAVDSQLQGDRRTYQQDPANRREGRREAALDRAEGADIIMVKPAMAYLDVLADVARDSDIPVWAYQVSGEYAMICAAAAHGWIDRDRAMREAVTGILRAGADAVLTYAAVELSKERA